MQKRQEGVILQYHQNLSVLTYMYIGVIRTTCEYYFNFLLTCIQFQVLF